MKFTEKQGKMLCLLGLVLIVVALVVLLYTVNAEIAPGLDAGHPPEYLTVTFMICSLITALLPIMWYLGIVRLPFWFTLLIIANLYYYCLSLFFGFYLTIDWWGTVAHIISSMFVSSIVFIALCIVQEHSPRHVSLGSNNGIIALQILIGTCFGGIWEAMEGYVDIVLSNQYMSYGIWDMLVDLRADLAGALIMGVIFWLMLRRYSVSEIARSTKIGFGLKKDGTG